ncbi:MAG: hypothetical protein ABI399_01575 [Bauldia sp.]
MRFIFGLVIGIALTLGAFYLHDSSVAKAGEPDSGGNGQLAAGDVEIVNWDVLGRVTREQVAFARDQFNKLIGN